MVSYYRAFAPKSEAVKYMDYRATLNMDAHRDPRRALKSAQEQEDWRRHRNERDRVQCAAETAKGAKDWESGGRGIVPSTLLKLLVKDELPHSREVSVNAKEWQLKPLRREKEDYSG